MQPKTEPNTTAFRGNCIGCSDCKGFCRELLDLAFLPEAVLKASTVSR